MPSNGVIEGEVLDERALVLTGPRSELPDLVVLPEPAARWAIWIDCRDRWLENKERVGGSRHTRRTYATAWKQFFGWATNTPPWAITSVHVQAWVAHLTEDLGLADTTVNLKLAALSSFYHYAATRYTVIADGREVALFGGRVNPFKNVDRIRTTPYGRSQYPSFDEVQRILASIRLETAQGWRDMALLLGFYLTARRSSEWLHLKWGDIHEGERGRYFTYRAKRGQVKKAALPAELWQVIRRYLQAVGRWESMTDEDYIFTALHPERAARLGVPVEPNKPISNATANRILKKYGRRAGVPLEKCHLHGLRHAAARRRYERGDDLMEISKLLAHANISVTQIYTDCVLNEPEDTSAHELFAEVAPRQLKLAL